MNTLQSHVPTSITSHGHHRPSRLKRFYNGHLVPRSSPRKYAHIPNPFSKLRLAHLIESFTSQTAPTRTASAQPELLRY